MSPKPPDSGAVQCGEIYRAELNMVEEGINIRSGGVQLNNHTNEFCVERVEER